MKRNTKITFVKVMAAFLAGVLTMTACKKDDEGVMSTTCTGVPAITSVTTPVERSTPITGGGMAEWVIIHGSNFCNVEKIIFSNMEVDVKDAYFTDSSITVKIPSKLPSQLTHQLELASATGRVAFDFQLMLPPIPQIRVYGMNNEYTPAGDTMVIRGKNFYLNVTNRQASKVLFGTAEGTILPASTDTTLFVVVPAEALAGSRVKIIGAGAAKEVVPYSIQEEVTAYAPFLYKDNRNMLFSSDPFRGWNGQSYVTDNQGPGAIQGNYIYFKKTVPAGWQWDPITGELFSDIPQDVVKNPENYLFKFEVNTMKSFKSIFVQFIFDEKPLDYRPKSTNGKWETCTIEFIDIVKGPLEAKDGYVSQFSIMGPEQEDIDVAFDSFRIVPKTIAVTVK